MEFQQYKTFPPEKTEEVEAVIKEAAAFIFARITMDRADIRETLYEVIHKHCDGLAPDNKNPFECVVEKAKGMIISGAPMSQQEREEAAEKLEQELTEYLETEYREWVAAIGEDEYREYLKYPRALFRRIPEFIPDAGTTGPGHGFGQGASVRRAAEKYKHQPQPIDVVAGRVFRKSKSQKKDGDH